MWEIGFTTDNRWLVTSTGRRWELHLAEGRAPDWLLDLAEVMAGLSSSQPEAFEAIPNDALHNLKRTLAAIPTTDRLASWARKFIADEPLPASP